MSLFNLAEKVLDSKASAESAESELYDQLRNGLSESEEFYEALQLGARQAIHNVMEKRRKLSYMDFGNLSDLQKANIAASQAGEKGVGAPFHPGAMVRYIDMARLYGGAKTLAQATKEELLASARRYFTMGDGNYLEGNFHSKLAGLMKKPKTLLGKQVKDSQVIELRRELEEERAEAEAA